MNSTPESQTPGQHDTEDVVAATSTEETPATSSPIAPENPALVSFRAMREAQAAVAQHHNHW